MRNKILIVDVSNKSTGLGIELGTIINVNKPIVFVAKHGCQISNMVLGAFPNIKVNYYKDLDVNTVNSNYFVSMLEFDILIRFNFRPTSVDLKLILEAIQH